MGPATEFTHDALTRALLDSHGHLPWVTQYSQVLYALYRLIRPPTPTHLLQCVSPVHILLGHVPWLQRELAHIVPLADFPALATAVDALYLPPIPYRGYTSYRVFTALRFGAADHPADKPLRALVLTLAGRATDPDNPQPARLSGVAQRCIDTISPALYGLYHHRSESDQQESLLMPLLEAAAKTQSLSAYVNTLRDHLLDEPEIHQGMTARFRHDVHRALGLELRKPDIDDDRPVPLEPDEPPPDDDIITIQPTPVPDHPIPEPADEYQPTIAAIEMPAKRAGTSFLELLREARHLRRPQQIRHANTLLLELHADVLTRAESQLLAPALTNAGMEAIAAGERAYAIQLAVGALILCLGYEPKRASALLTTSAKSKSISALDDDQSHVVVPALSPPEAFEPKPQQVNHLVTTHPTFRIPLPPAVTRLLRSLNVRKSERALIGDLRDGVSGAIANVAANLNLNAITMGRLRRVASAYLYEHSRDLPAVMHLTRDSFGQSLAPVYYCCLQESYLQQIYRGAIWPLWEHDVSDDDVHENSGNHVGSSGLVRQEHVRAIAHSIGAPLQGAIREPPTTNDLVRVHNSLVSHIAGMLIAVVGHRPENSLFNLTLHDFDVDYGAATFHDKQIDIAHHVRLVGLGTRVSEQIRAYLDHLTALSDRKCLPQHTKTRIRQALTGKASLLFRLGHAGAPEPMTIAYWRDHLPKAWHRVPINWGRHYIASIGRKLGISPELLHVQLGHYEAVGYPYSPDSPLSPLDFLEKVNPIVDEIFRRQGWSCRRKLSTDTRPMADWAVAGPLHLWKRQKREHLELCRRHRAMLRLRFRADQTRVREQAQDLVMERSREVSGDLGSLIRYRVEHLRARHSAGPVHGVGRSDGSQSTDAQRLPEPVRLRTADLLALQENLEQATSGDPGLRIAARNTLSRCLIWAARNHLYTGMVPGILVQHVPRDPSPFLVGHLQATHQIRLLRQAVRAGMRDVRFQQRSDYRLGTVALCLIVYGGVDHLETLRNLFLPNVDLLGIRAISDALIACVPESGESIGLRGIAAIAYARWQSETHMPEPVDRARLEVALQLVVPPSAIGTDNLLTSLLVTMQMCNRIERSGICNYALDPETGAVPLTHDRLRQFLGHLPSQGTLETQAKERPKTAARPVVRKQVQKEYQAIKKVWPNKQRDIELPLTGQLVERSRRTRPSRKKRVYDELLQMERQPDWSRLMRYLAGWLAWELANQRPQAGEFRPYGGVYSQFTEIGSRFAQLHDPCVDDFVPEDMEALYLETARGAANTNLQRIVRASLSYHRYVVLYHNVDAIDTSELAALLPRHESVSSSVDNQLMMPAELEAGEQALNRNANPDDTIPHDQTRDLRLLRQAHVLYLLIRSSGARIGELVGLQSKDILCVGKRIYIRIRTTGYQSVKTPSARRIVELSDRLSDREIATIRNWLVSEQRMGHLRQGAQYVFCSLDGAPLGRHSIYGVLRELYTGISTSPLRSHHCRHTAVTERFLELELGLKIEQLQQHSPRIRAGRSLLPRDLQRQIRQFGHKLPRTSIRSYMHVPWTFQLAAQDRDEYGLDRHVLAGCLGVSLAAADKRLQRHGAEAASKAIRSLIRLEEPGKRDQDKPPTIVICPQLRHARLSLYVHSVACGKPLGDAARTYGIRKTEHTVLTTRARQQAERSGIHLFPAFGGTITPPRWYGESRSLQQLWELVELRGPDSAAVREACAEWYAHCSRSTRARIRLSKVTITQLQHLVEPWGYKVQQKTDSERADTLIVEVEVTHRDTPERGLNHTLAWVLSIGWVIDRTLHDLEQTIE